MAQLKAPDNFSVIRSEDRLSALLMWDSVTEDIAGATATAVAYTLYQSDRNNGLGYATVADIPHKAGAARQYTAIDNLEADMLYNFTITAVDTYDEESAPSTDATDF